MYKRVTNLFRFLHHFFIPHAHNEYRPHIFREVSIAVILLASLITFAVSITSALIVTSPSGPAIVTRVLVDLTNDHRVENGLAPLLHNEILDNAALLKAKDMAMWSYFAHYSPTGVTPWSFFDKVGYVFLFAGENLAINFNESKAVEDAWMASPKHKQNILDTRFKEIGIGTQEGTYDGYPTIYVVQFFGSPALRSTTVVATTTKPKAAAVKNKVISASGKSSIKSSRELAENTRVKGAETTLFANDMIPADERVVGGAVSATSTDGDDAEGTVLALTTTREGEDSSVRDTDPTLTAVAKARPTSVTYSTWYERTMLAFPRNLQMAYTIILIILLIASLSFVGIEIKREHHKHIIYVALITVIILLLMYFNKTYIISQIPFIKY